MATDASEERLALYVDHENVAIGARDIGYHFQIGPLLDALAERGRLLVRRSYADWNLFRDDRRNMVDGNMELIEIPQRNDSVRKNAADIKMAVDAMELALTSDYISTFVIVSGDSDFTPLVSKLRELNKRVIGVGLKGSTSKMLPPACDEFIFYDRLDSAPLRQKSQSRSKSAAKSSRRGGGSSSSPSNGSSEKQAPKSSQQQDLKQITRLITKTLSGLQGSASGPILASNLKRALLRKDPTFSETDYGFRGFREFLRHLSDEGQLTLTDGSAPGDPEVDIAKNDRHIDSAFELLKSTVVALMVEAGGDPPLSGLKDQLRKTDPEFSEKDYGYGGFLQFCKAAESKGVVKMDWEEDDKEHYLYVADEDLTADQKKKLGVS